MSMRPAYIKPGEDVSLYGAGALREEGALAGDGDARSAFVYNRHRHLPVEEQRQRLPIHRYRDHILYLLERHQTLVLVGDTGCGKSTQLPQYLLDVGHVTCVCEPRACACVSLCARVCAERGLPGGPGGEVGWAAGGTSQRNTNTRLTFATEGVVLREMLASPLLMQYSCIVLDEVHERSLMTDVLMGLLKKIIKKRKNLKLVVSSATMEAEFLRQYFDVSEPGGRATAAVMAVPGRSHAVDIYYTLEPVAEYVRAAVDTVIKIHENEPFGDVLVFLAAQEEVCEAVEALRQYAVSNRETMQRRDTYRSGVRCAHIDPLPLYGTLPVQQQIRVFQSAERNVRKVVVATNIAETSVTIPGIVYVVDSGFHRLPFLDAAAGVERVALVPIARTNAVQRAGRAGRTAPGKCYRLYPESEYEALAARVPPEMCRADLTGALLHLKALGINNVLRFPFPSPPAARGVLCAVETLLALGAVDGAGALTPDGRRMAEMPLRPALARVLLNSAEFGCMEEALSIVSMLQVEGVFAHRDKPAARLARRKHFEVAEGDIIMYLNVMDAYMRLRTQHEERPRRERACREWCRNMYINYNVIEKAYEIRSSLEKLMKDKYQMRDKQYEGPDLGSGKVSRVSRCVCSGLFMSAARRSAALLTQYTNTRGADLYLQADSCLRDNPPQWLVFSSACSDREGRVVVRDALAVQRDWLLELAPHYYTQI